MEDQTPAPRPADAVQVPLPFGPDDPIPFRLTARARRHVDPASLPQLRVLDDHDHDRDHVRDHDEGEASGRRPVAPAVHDTGPVDLDDPHDTRPSRARALRRAGVASSQIADELGVDSLVAQAWIDDVVPTHTARRRLRAVRPDAGRVGPAVPADAGSADAVDRLRADARREAAARLAEDPAFATGLGLAAGILTTSDHAAVIATRDRVLAAAVLRWLLTTTEVDPQRVRVLLRLAPQVAGDAAAHDWAGVLDVPPEQVAFTRWRAAPDASAVEATIRIADGTVAARLAGWRDALLGHVAGRAPVDEDF